jgi:hypothetical protein
MMNRNKRGIAVNLKVEGGVEVVKRLVATADVDRTTGWARSRSSGWATTYSQS